MSKPILLFIAVLLGGCDPTRFAVLSDRDIDCRIYSDHRLVRKLPAGFTMLPGACVSTTYLWATQYMAKYRLMLEEGEGVKILLRPIVEEQILDSGMVLTLARNGYRLVHQDTLLASGSLPGLRKGQPETFRAYSDEGYLEVTFGCDTLYRGITKRIEGDDIIFCTLPESTVMVFNPQWRDTELDYLGQRELIETGGD